jgi:hypothetical protein
MRLTSPGGTGVQAGEMVLGCHQRGSGDGCELRKKVHRESFREFVLKNFLKIRDLQYWTGSVGIGFSS